MNMPSPRFTPQAAIRPMLSGANVENGLVRSDIPPASLAFFAALNDCVTASGQLHPVHARNSKLVQAWQNWTAWQEGESHDSVADQLIANLRRRFDQNVELLEKAIRIDPAWKQGQIKRPSDPQAITTSAVLAAAPLMFWRQPHALIELTSALEHWLVRSDLSDEIPVELLRSPIPACYIRFGPELQEAIIPPKGEAFPAQCIEGVYVFAAQRDNARAIALVPIFHLAGLPRLGVGNIDIVINNEQQPLVEIIQNICADLPLEQRDHFQSIAQLCTKIFLYMNLEQAQRVEEKQYTDAVSQLKRVGPKKAAKLERQVGKLYDRILVGPQTLPHYLDNVRGEVSPHWRRGHFRLQPYGSQMSLRKVMFIAPTLVRADLLQSGA